MKILLIHCHYRLPGGEDAVFAAERALLERRGHTVVVYERSNEEAAHGLAKLLLPLHAVWNRRAAREVRDLIAREKPDAVHIHNTLLLLSPAVVRAAKESGVPVVQTLHNFRLVLPQRHSAAAGQGLRGLPPSRPFLRRAPPVLPGEPVADAGGGGGLCAPPAPRHLAGCHHGGPHRL